MSDDGKRAERDKNLVRETCSAVNLVRSALFEWIQEELKDQRVKAQFLQETVSGPIKSAAQEYEKDIDELDRRRLPEAVDLQKAQVKEVQQEFNDDPFDDYMYLEGSTFRLERMARMIYRMRRILDDLASPDAASEGIDSSQEDHSEET